MITEEKEAAMVYYLNYMTQQGFPMSRMIVRQYVITFVRISGRQALFNQNRSQSDHWYQNCFAIHIGLIEKEPERQDHSRSRLKSECDESVFHTAKEYCGQTGFEILTTFTLATNHGLIHKNDVLNKAKCTAVLSHGFEKLCSPARIKETFRKTGMLSVILDDIDKTHLIKSHLAKSTAENLPCTSAINIIKAKIVDTITTCATSGSYLGGNPLVKEDLIPPSFRHISSSTSQSPGRQKKALTEAKIITTYEFYKKLEEKDETEKERKLEVERRNEDGDKRKRNQK
ncbi:hypothetical protein CHS0354_003679 [Potamilus streckersoni]|uniref:Uncharacterized protein n=1 Tax=Potamilus streckersoni TaxID=2493646 RepID=A0AAE0W0Q9_9BIVA|nr:hypothetical protein CHS0354_003679 [Potamilus streckersoni]